jgi:hypothetical protein
MPLLGRYGHLRPNDIPPLLLSTGGIAAATLLAELQFAESNAGLWVLGAAVVLLSGLGAAESLIRGNIAQDTAERRKRRTLARSLIHGICDAAVREMSACPDKTGVIVFLPEDDGLLHATFTYHKDDRPDRGLAFRPLQGCTGHAWDTGRQTVARLEEVTEEDLRLTWKLTAEQITATRHLKMVVSTPIWAGDDPEQKLGVVSVDTEGDEADCQIASEESLNEALQLATMLSAVLKLADLVQSE